MSTEVTSVTLKLDMERVLPCAQKAAEAINGLTSAERTAAIAMLVFAVGGPNNYEAVLDAVVEMTPQIAAQADQ